MTGDPGQTGVHAWKSMSGALTYGLPFAHRDEYGTIVVGQVDLWGEIVEHEKGYRAENAAIVSLDGILGGDKDRGRLLEALRKRYGVGGDEAGTFADWLEEAEYDYDDKRALRQSVRQQIPVDRSKIFTPRSPVATFLMSFMGVTIAGALFGMLLAAFG